MIRKNEIMQQLIAHDMILDEIEERLTLIEKSLEKKTRKKNVKVSK